MTLTVTSRGDVPIRLTDERWAHIVEEHAELAGMREGVMRAVLEAECVLAGGAGELIGVLTLEAGRALVVVYREVSPDDGFILTAFLSSQLAKLYRRRQLWP